MVDPKGTFKKFAEARRVSEEEKFLEWEKEKIPKIRKVSSKLDRKSGKKYLRKPSLDDRMFSRAEILHQMLMEEFHFLEAVRKYSGGFEGSILTYDDVTDREMFRDAALAHPQALVMYDQFTYCSPSKVFHNLSVEPDIRTLRLESRLSRWPPVGVWSRWVLATPLFTFVMVMIIVVNSITIAVDQELGHEEGDLKIRLILEAMDFFFLCMFVVEILFKWMDDFGGFWNEGWNMFDFLITATSLIAPILDIFFLGAQEEESLEDLLLTVRYLRIIRIFRSLNVVTRIHKIALIWAAVVKTFSAMVSILFLMGIFFYIFAIIGIQIFHRYTQSHLPNLEYRTSFSNLANAFVTLFQLFTLDHWFNLLTETSEVMGYAGPTAFILIWILLGSFIFRNIFVGVTVNNFQNIRQSILREAGELQSDRRFKNTINVFGLDKLENRTTAGKDRLTNWEAEIIHNLKILKGQKAKLSPIMWPRDTMFQHYMLLEAMASNLDERHAIFKLIDDTLVEFLDP